jgi:hypothetical protein
MSKDRKARDLYTVPSTKSTPAAHLKNSTRFTAALHPKTQHFSAQCLPSLFFCSKIMVKIDPRLPN